MFYKIVLYYKQIDSFGWAKNLFFTVQTPEKCKGGQNGESKEDGGD